MAKISVLDVSVDNSFIRATQVLTIRLDMNVADVFALGKNLYLELSFSYSEWIRRSETIPTDNGDCHVSQTGSTTNLATSCSYISKRVLRITVHPHNGQLYTVKISNLKSPSFLPI